MSLVRRYEGCFFAETVTNASATADPSDHGFAVRHEVAVTSLGDAEWYSQADNRIILLHVL
jgi:hypothetical protein